jgi:hypothetical protein
VVVESERRHDLVRRRGVVKYRLCAGERAGATVVVRTPFSVYRANPHLSMGETMHRFASVVVLFLVTGTSTLARAEDLVVKFINNTDEEYKGCVLMAWDNNGNRRVDGQHPVGPHQTVIFKMQPCSDYKYWRFVAAIAYSDNPDNLTTVLVDTGKRAVTKCQWEIEGNKQ